MEVQSDQRLEIHLVFLPCLPPLKLTDILLLNPTPSLSTAHFTPGAKVSRAKHKKITGSRSSESNHSPSVLWVLALLTFVQFRSRRSWHWRGRISPKWLLDSSLINTPATISAGFDFLTICQRAAYPQ